MRLIARYLIVLICCYTASVAAVTIDEADQAVRVRDYRTAISIYRQLANSGNAEAAYQLAVMYRNGQGVTANHAEAFRWFRTSAKSNYARAQYNLGLMYEKGWGTDRNLGLARKWYKRAVAQKYKPAEKRLATLAKNTGSSSKELRHALVQAVRQGDAAETRRLLARYKHPGRIKEGSLTLMMIAATHGYKNVCQSLLKAGVPLNARDTNGRTALVHAIQAGQERMAMWLLRKKGIDTVKADHQGVTPLMEASQANIEPVVHKIVQLSPAAINSKDKQGQTALDKAQRRGHKKLATYLRQQGGKSGKPSRVIAGHRLNAGDNNSGTP